jgi:hypothetical protein
MPCIVNPVLYPTKKSLRLALLSGREVWANDPSYFTPRDFCLQHIPEGRVEFVTNHPKRSWFAQVSRKAGKVVVK